MLLLVCEVKLANINDERGIDKMFKVGDFVRLKNNKELVGKVITVTGSKELSYMGFIMGYTKVIYRVKLENGNSLDLCEDYLELIPQIAKTNIINYNSGQSIMSWRLINKNNLKVKIHSGRIVLGTLLKILISEIDELKEFNYRRVSPYQIKWERPISREDKKHVYKIIFMDIKDGNKIKESEILKLDCNLCLNEGEYNLFIPDLLEVARARGLVKLENDIYIFIESKFNKELDIKYLDDSMSRENLVSNGWIVPDGYKEQVSLYA